MLCLDQRESTAKRQIHGKLFFCVCGCHNGFAVRGAHPCLPARVGAAKVQGLGAKLFGGCPLCGRNRNPNGPTALPRRGQSPWREAYLRCSITNWRMFSGVGIRISARNQKRPDPDLVLHSMRQENQDTEFDHNPTVSALCWIACARKTCIIEPCFPGIIFGSVVVGIPNGSAHLFQAEVTAALDRFVPKERPLKSTSVQTPTHRVGQPNR